MFLIGLEKYILKEQRYMGRQVYNNNVSLFPNEDVVTKEIESWKGFADNIRSEKDRQLFQRNH